MNVVETKLWLYRALLVLCGTVGGVTDGKGQSLMLPLSSVAREPLKKIIPRHYADQVVDGDRLAKKLELKFPAAQLDLKSLAKTTANCIEMIQKIDARGGIGELSQGEALAKEFDQYCLGGVETIPLALRSAGIEKLVGIVQLNDSIVCTAFRISRRVAMTAKHCFYDQREGTQLVTAGPTHVRFTLIDNEKTELSAIVVTCPTGLIAGGCPPIPLEPIGARVDFVYLLLPEAAPPLVSAPVVELAFNQTDALFLIGFFPHVLPTSNLPAREMVRWSKNAPCRVAYSDGICLYHSCQAVAGSSGAGIFSIDTKNGKLSLIGMHLAGVNGDHRDCPAEATGKLGNLAARLNPSQVSVSITD